ncbi:RES domain-containing protein [Tistlia consotensis]|uniref:RES domain-containing protein n=1 Tax=Tistlia consotensis USBA 355 TaxID=560819 RepID=A0A1Y6BU69_9PROT|nr:RES domain-containing protein [Tistlia consotensis]SMF28147.1 RES domain-containing protein [Tistlia consotensis USBA 355]SNR65113.1 RES domain-containing protein [Tistlia consotensis]
MTPRLLPDPLKAYRIGDPAGAHPVFSAEGARRTQGRWHDRGDAVIYAGEHYSTAMLETLVHWNGILPPNQHFVEITLPAGLTYELVTADILPGWHQPGGEAARRFGHRWYAEQRSAVLMVPSVVARVERNVVINAAHPEFQRISCGLETPVWWDQRLFR